jgi:hypothetical protein
MISAVPSVSSVHVELDGRLPSTAGRTDETTKLVRLTTVRQQPRVLVLLDGSGSITEREPNRGIRPRESPTEVPL